jgi:transcriptional regulator with XRE-family HTH domain
MTHPIDAFVGRRIREIRLQQNKRMTDVTKAFGGSFQQLQKYEKGANRVSASRLAEIAQIFDVPISAFFPPEFQSRELSSEERKLLEHFRSADPGAQSSLATIAAKIAEAEHA